LTAAEPRHVSRFATTSDYYGLLIRNTGNKTSREVYWRILLAEDSRHLQAAGGRELDPVRLDGLVHRQLAGFFERPIFPTRSGFIVALKVARADGHPRPVTVRWVLVSEDGRVPEDEEAYATLTIDANGVSSWLPRPGAGQDGPPAAGDRDVSVARPDRAASDAVKPR
jgi:hypothetical protein